MDLTPLHVLASIPMLARDGHGASTRTSMDTLENLNEPAGAPFVFLYVVLRPACVGAGSSDMSSSERSQDARVTTRITFDGTR